MGDSKGVWKTRSLHRRPVEERWDADLLSKVRGVPWRTSDEDPDVDGEKLPGVVRVMTEVEEQNENTMAEEKVPRSFQITKEDLGRHGYSDGCPGCKAILRGTARQGHTHGCRRRLETAMANEEKVKKSAEKEKEFIEKALEEEDKLRKEKLKVRFEDEEEGPTKRRKGESDDRDEPEEKGQKREQEEGQGSEEQPRRRRRRGRQGAKRNAENEAERDTKMHIGPVQCAFSLAPPWDSVYVRHVLLWISP